jgi:hypothetical protein
VRRGAQPLQRNGMSAFTPVPEADGAAALHPKQTSEPQPSERAALSKRQQPARF